MLTIRTSQNYRNVTFLNQMEWYKVKLKVKEVQNLAAMLFECVNDPVNLHNDDELELLVLVDILRLMEKKVHSKFTASLTLSRSQARTLFLWLNECHFEEPYQEFLAAAVVAQIDKQIPVDAKGYGRGK